MKILSLLIIASLFVLGSCSSVKTSSSSSGKNAGSGPVNLTKTASDDTYGYSSKNPIKVGGVVDSQGPAMERRFLDQLAGPNGEEISYHRASSCCNFKTPNGFMGGGLLDVYEVTYEGSGGPIELYINMYDYEEPMIPVGFTRK
ncbi:MAG: 2-dehydro-3-deoxyphosphooctonate aldolase [bacterium]|nr:2-dehydro-3-deoxyphosphooctonate aldolase [bacterium]